MHLALCPSQQVIEVANIFSAFRVHQAAAISDRSNAHLRLGQRVSRQKTPINQGASVLLWRWPQMKAFIEQAAPGSMFELSINRRTGFVPLAVK
jgi:hypothetical protein